MYSTTRTDPTTSTPLETLLQLVALKVERDQAAIVSRPSDDDLREVVSALYEVATGNFDVDEVLALATRRACSMTGATGAAIALRQGEAYICRSSLGENAPGVGASFSADSGISGQCVKTAQILACRDTDFDPRVNAAVCRQLGIRSMVAVPVFHHGSVCGILEVFAGRPSAFHDRDTYLLQLLSSLVGHSVQDKEFAVLDSAVRCRQQISRPAVEVDWLRRLTQSAAGVRPGMVAGFLSSALLFAVLWSAIPRRTPPEAGASSVTNKDSGRPASARAPEAQSATIPATINAIEFKSHGQFTAIKIALARPVRHESGRLQNPERIYFDLSDSVLGASFGGGKTTMIEVNDSYVSRIRAVQTPDQGTRIVLDLKCACDYTAVLPETAPYELSILVQPPRASNHPGTASLQSFEFAQPIVPAPAPANVFRAASGKLTIVIDPGHGGTDLGTTGPDGLAEKDLVLDIAHRLGTMLKANLGANVVFTRTDDRFISLERRDRIANESHADLLISIHANSSSDRLTRGVETFYYTGQGVSRQNATAAPILQPVALRIRSTQTKQLAGVVQRELYAALSSKDQALRNRGVKQAEFALLVNAGMPAVLTEVGFISSPSDEQNLSRSEARQVIANGLFHGISGFVRKQSLAAGL